MGRDTSIGSTGGKQPTFAISASGRLWLWASPRRINPQARGHRGARIAQLVKKYGYQGFAGLSALWPAPNSGYPFGIYMNGGRAEPDVLGNRSSDARGDWAGAARRLKLFAQRAEETSWAGDNTATIRGNTFGEATGGDHEPYLADMVVVAASLIQGIMGVRPTWQRLEVTPCLPAEWPSVAADILYKGRRHHVAIENGKVHIQPLEQVINLPLTWTMDFNLRTAPGGVAATSNTDFLGPYDELVVLKKSRDDRAKLKAGESPLDRDCPSPFGVPQVSYVASGT